MWSTSAKSPAGFFSCMWKGRTVSDTFKKWAVYIIQCKIFLSCLHPRPCPRPTISAFSNYPYPGVLPIRHLLSGFFVNKTPPRIKVNSTYHRLSVIGNLNVNSTLQDQILLVNFGSNLRAALPYLHNYALYVSRIVIRSSEILHCIRNRWIAIIPGKLS